MAKKTRDDRYAINAGYAEMREGYRTSDVERIMAVYAKGLGDLADGFPSLGREEALEVRRKRLQKLFADGQVTWTPVIAAIEQHGTVAITYGWHSLTIQADAESRVCSRRSRFVHVWRKSVNGEWHLQLIIDNKDQVPMLAEDVVAELCAGTMNPISGESISTCAEFQREPLKETLGKALR